MTKSPGEVVLDTPPNGGGSTAERENTAPPARQLHVLVVDDDRVDRLALIRALQQTRFGVTVGEANGVLAAIDLLAGQQFDCVLLDYNLPDGDGLTFLRGLRGAGISTTVIMITGQLDDTVASNLMAAGAADYIPKTLFTPSRLSNSLNRLFGKQATRNDTDVHPRD